MEEERIPKKKDEVEMPINRPRGRLRDGWLRRVGEFVRKRREDLLIVNREQ